MSLVIMRRIEEAVYLDLPDGKKIKVVVAGVQRGRNGPHGDKVKLAFDMPPEVNLWREELLQTAISATPTAHK